MLWRYSLIRLPFYGNILLNDSSFLISTFPFMYKLKVNQDTFLQEYEIQQNLAFRFVTENVVVTHYYTNEF